jgi:hypothetical protein
VLSHHGKTELSNWFRRTKRQFFPLQSQCLATQNGSSSTCLRVAPWVGGSPLARTSTSTCRQRSHRKSAAGQSAWVSLLHPDIYQRILAEDAASLAAKAADGGAETVFVGIEERHDPLCSPIWIR